MIILLSLCYLLRFLRILMNEMVCYVIMYIHGKIIFEKFTKALNISIIP